MFVIDVMTAPEATAEAAVAPRDDRPRTQTLSRLDVGALVREVRRRAGLTQRDLAAMLGTTQSAVSTWERGHDVPRVDTLARILAACGFEADLVFRRHDDVDRSQIAGTLSQTPETRLTTVRNVNELLGLADRTR
jgi:transcriptional regulator with XRE-family HTH domain